jgi:hypothetical protein
VPSHQEESDEDREGDGELNRPKPNELRCVGRWLSADEVAELASAGLSRRLEGHLTRSFAEGGEEADWEMDVGVPQGLVVAYTLELPSIMTAINFHGLPSELRPWLQTYGAAVCLWELKCRTARQGLAKRDAADSQEE